MINKIVFTDGVVWEIESDHPLTAEEAYKALTEGKTKLLMERLKQAGDPYNEVKCSPLMFKDLEGFPIFEGDQS